MPEVVSVIFKEAGPSYYFDPADTYLEVGDWVIVETARGLVMGKVVAPPMNIPDEKIEKPLKSVKRKAGEEEFQKYEEFKAQEGKVLAECGELVAKHDLPMKLVAAEYNFDGSHLTIFFSSEGKVDFRALLKEMGATFKTRVELRQIGARDVAKLLGGIGRCGRTLCCTTFLTKFVPISVRMARDQSLPLNPATISGACGKLLCCLKYEHQQYSEMKTQHPTVGSRVITPRGEGQVRSINHLKETAMVRLESETTVEVEISQIAPSKGERGQRNVRK